MPQQRLRMDSRKEKQKENHSEFKAFLDVMRTGTTAFTGTFTAGYCTQALAHSPLPSVPSRARKHTPPRVHTPSSHTRVQSTYRTGGASAQYVQVHRGGLGEALEHAVDLLDVQPHVGLPLPAAQHQVVHLFRTGSGPLQHAALRDALDHLQDSGATTHCCSAVVFKRKRGGKFLTDTANGLKHELG